MARLRYATPPEWAPIVLKDFDAFLADHAACERKAAANALSFITPHRDKPTLVAAMIDLAREELEHFAQVHALLVERGAPLGPDEPNLYANRLRAAVRHGKDEHFLDRLLVAGLIEARSCERLGLVAEALDAGPMKEFYVGLERAEGRHHGLFVSLAREFFPAAAVEARLDEYLDLEAAIIASLPFRSAVH